MEWDLCSSTFRILFSMGTNKVPPPEPKTPLINPVKEPIKQFLKLKEEDFNKIFTIKKNYKVEYTANN